MEGTAQKIFWGITIAGYLAGATWGLIENRKPENYVTSYSCIQSNGARVDPRNGDGPECVKYGYVRGPENLFVPLVIIGGAGAFVTGWIGLFAAIAYDHFEGPE